MFFLFSAFCVFPTASMSIAHYRWTKVHFSYYIWLWYKHAYELHTSKPSAGLEECALFYTTRGVLPVFCPEDSLYTMAVKIQWTGNWQTAPLHRGAFCQFPFRWIYYCHSSKSTGMETGKTHLCALCSGALTAVFLKLVQCQSQQNREIQPFVVEEIRFTHT